MGMSATKEEGTTESKGVNKGSGSAPPGNLVKPKWTEGQKFTPEDDPDRIQLEVPLPKFLSQKDPHEQGKKLKVEDLKLPWIPEGETRYFVKVVHNIFTAEECRELIATINHKGFTPALLNIGRGRQQYVPAVRKGWRCILSSPALADYMCEVLRERVLPEVFMNGALVDVNEYCRFLFYEPGGDFKPHYDGQYSRPPEHPNAGDSSKITIQLYLNDMDVEHGGATALLDPLGQHEDIPCQPRAGMALIFSQNLLHEGSEVKEGGIKYTMRTEAMYRYGEEESPTKGKYKFDKTKSAKALAAAAKGEASNSAATSP